MMAASDDEHTVRRGNPTAVDQVNPFDSTIVKQPSIFKHHETQLSIDPPTAIVHRDSFRELLPGSIVDDTYEVDARLGAGAMGEVYAAKHIKLGKRVAIKVIGRRLSADKSAIERFAMEARTLAQIQHPAIVTVDHIGELADGRAYFVMELLRGTSLFDRLHHGRVQLNEALRVLDQMARGLEAAHSQGVIHRDLKPENTFLVHLPGEDQPSVKLLDFGLSKLVAERAELDQRAERTQSGVAIGTPMYMSPEQMRGPDVDHRTDIYALGCVAYELVLGISPFPAAKTSPELFAAHLHESPPLPRSIWPEIPPQLDLCLFAMLAKDPAHRPTLTQVRSVIATVRDTTEQRAKTAVVQPRAVKASPRWLLITGIAIATLAGGIAIGSAWTSAATEHTPAPPPPAAHEPVPPTPPAMQTSTPVAEAPTPAANIGSNSPPTPTPTPTPTPRTSPSPPQPRLDDRPHGKPSTRPGSAATAAVQTLPLVPAPIDASITAEPAPRDRSLVEHPIDRNQTVNPFVKKPKVNP